MADYIDRTQLEPDTEWSDYDDGFVSYSQSQIRSMPKADVVEREKVNKAIEEIKQLRRRNTDCSGYRWWDNAICNVLCILRDLGE